MAYLETGFSQTRGPFTRARLAASGILCYAQNDDQETENDRKNFMNGNICFINPILRPTRSEDIIVADLVLQ